MKQPLVSIITPIHNGEKTVRETIESVLSQNYKNFEMIIVDDVSTDNSVKIIKEYQVNDKRIKLFQLEKQGGASVARNYALKQAKGKYIAFLDCDDLWYPEKLNKQVNYMEKNNIDFCYTDYEYINDKGEKLNKYRKCPKKVTYLRMLLGCSVGCLTVIYNREKAGDINISKIKKRNDYAIWCLVLKKVKKGYKYDEILSMYRKSDNSLSSGKKVKLLKYHYTMHREINNFNPLVAAFLTMTNVINYFVNIKIRDKKIKE